MSQRPTIGCSDERVRFCFTSDLDGLFSRDSYIAALAIAIAADAIQIGLLPLFLEGATSPWNDALDIGVGAALIALLGWNKAFLPAFLGELVPFLNLFPTWTATVVFVVTRKR